MTSPIFDFTIHPHHRCNILTGEWVLVSPHRSKRPWQGKMEDVPSSSHSSYLPDCYLCPGNKRSGEIINPSYSGPYSFTNDFAALLPDVPLSKTSGEELFKVETERGICRVICFSPDHRLSLPLMEVQAIAGVVKLWVEEFLTLASHNWIKYIQVFENKGELMGCSNPHPHGQIWAQANLPVEIKKELIQQQKYYQRYKRTLLSDYLLQELSKQERIVCSNDHFVALVPFWAVWPFEVLVVSRQARQYLHEFNEEERESLANMIKRLTTRYDNLFNCSFPYSAGIHQAPVNDRDYPEWHWHMHFYPPLLRSATVKKFMVGYELLANPQRDITPEVAAVLLRAESEIHYLTLQETKI